MNEETIHESIDAADEAMPNCPRPHVGANGGHWWYLDDEGNEGDQIEFVCCICKTCGQKMKLAATADEYPAV